jgi:hypothetical protein
VENTGCWVIVAKAGILNVKADVPVNDSTPVVVTRGAENDVRELPVNAIDGSVVSAGKEIVLIAPATAQAPVLVASKGNDSVESAGVDRFTLPTEVSCGNERFVRLVDVTLREDPLFASNGAEMVVSAFPAIASEPTVAKAGSVSAGRAFAVTFTPPVTELSKGVVSVVMLFPVIPILPVTDASTGRLNDVAVVLFNPKAPVNVVQLGNAAVSRFAPAIEVAPYLVLANEQVVPVHSTEVDAP